MIKKIYNTGLKVLPCFGAVVLVACGSGTPNSVSLTATQGACVTASYQDMNLLPRPIPLPTR